MATVLASVARTSRLLIVEENPYQGGWGGTVASIVADEGFESLDAPIRRVAAECVPLPFADALEDEVIPTTAKVIGGTAQRCWTTSLAVCWQPGRLPAAWGLSGRPARCWR